MKTEIDWKTKALCREYPPDLWYPEKPGTASGKDAIKICRRCTVRADCARDALARGERWAIAAGFRTSRASQRASMRDWLRKATTEGPRRITMPEVAEVPKARASRICSGCQQPILPGQRVCRSCRKEVPADPVLRHIDELRDAGLGLPEIAEAAPMLLGALKLLIYRQDRASPARYMSAANAARLLAIPVPVSPGSGATTDS